MKGEVVGINTAIIPQGQGIGFAIPVNTAKPLIPQLVSAGTITRGYLGINIQTLTPELAEALKVEEANGALVADVVSGSPAKSAGIKRGDIIIGYNGKEAKDSHDLPMMVATTAVDEEVTVTVLRDGKEFRLPVTVGRLASDEAGIGGSAEPAKGKWGLQLRDLDDKVRQQLRLQTDTGVVVIGVEPGSPAEAADGSAASLIAWSPVTVNHSPGISQMDRRTGKHPNSSVIETAGPAEGDASGPAPPSVANRPACPPG